jgi:hypothetical protein
MDMSVFRSLLVLVILFIAAPYCADLIAQPPGLPSAPDQAPIDGGLGLLAAGGAAYALKKLRKKQDA